MFRLAFAPLVEGVRPSPTRDPMPWKLVLLSAVAPVDDLCTGATPNERFDTAAAMLLTFDVCARLADLGSPLVTGLRPSARDQRGLVAEWGSPFLVREQLVLGKLFVVLTKTMRS